MAKQKRKGERERGSFEKEQCGNIQGRNECEEAACSAERGSTGEAMRALFLRRKAGDPSDFDTELEHEEFGKVRCRKARR